MTIAEQKLKVSLIEYIQKWMDDNCEEDDWNEVGSIYDDQLEDMAEAAFIVLKASKKGQAFLKEQS